MHNKEEPVNNEKAKNDMEAKSWEVENTQTIECEKIYEIGLEDS